MKVRIPIFGTVGKSVQIDTAGGAAFGSNLTYSDGVVVTLANLRTALGLTNSQGRPAMAHSSLSGLDADDHPLYTVRARPETISAVWSFSQTPVVPNDSWTYAKIQNASALSVLGRASNSSGDLADIAAASDTTLLRRSGTSVGFGTITSAYVSDFTEAAQDAVGVALTDTSEIDFTYSDVGNTISAALINGSIAYARLVDETALSVLGRSANSSGVTAAIAAGSDGDILRRSGTSIGFGSILSTSVSDFTEAAQDAVGGALTDSSEIDFTYSDAGNTITASIFASSIAYSRLVDETALSVLGRSANSAGVTAAITASSDGDVLRRSGTTLGFGSVLSTSISDFTEAVQDVVGAFATDSSEIDFSYSDGGNTLSAALINSSVAYARLVDESAISVLGRSANSVGVTAAISASADGQVLLRNGSALAFTAPTAPAAGFTISTALVFALANDLAGLEGLSTTGIAARTAASTWATRTNTGTTNRLSISNGDGVLGDPTFDISANYVGQASITTLGTITTGTWTGTTIAAANGGTGQTTYAVGDLLYASGTTALSKLADVAAGSYLRSGGVTTAPVWSTTTIPNTAVLGDIWYGSAANVVTALAGQITTAKKFLTQTGNGSVSAAPGWNTLVAGDIPSLGANPSVSIGLAAVNGSATTYLRSDGAPALDQGIVPTWSAQHTFTSNIKLNSANPRLLSLETGLAADTGFWDVNFDAGSLTVRTRTDADGTGVSALTLTRPSGTQPLRLFTGALDADLAGFSTTAGNVNNYTVVFSAFDLTRNANFALVSAQRPLFNMLKYSGTLTSPTQIGNNIALSLFSFACYNTDTAAIAPSAAISTTSTEAWSATAQGTRLDFGITPNGSLTRTVTLRLAELQVQSLDGTVGAPGQSWISDADSGHYRIGNNNVGLALNGANVVDYSTTRSIFTGDLKLGTAGNGFYIKEGTNATMGTAVLVLGTVVVNTTKVTANSRIQLTAQVLGTVTVPTALAVTARTAGTSFTILSSNLTDTSTVAWRIDEPA